MPTLDPDILGEGAVRALVDHVHEHYEESGYILPRIGKPPRCAIPFRTEEPFKKIVVISQMRKELAGAVTRLFARRRTEASQIDDEETQAIGKAIALAVRLRGAVARDYRSREIEAIYGAEGTARIGLALERLLAGLETLGMDRSRSEIGRDHAEPRKIRREEYQ